MWNTRFSQIASTPGSDEVATNDKGANYLSTSTIGEEYSKRQTGLQKFLIKSNLNITTSDLNPSITLLRPVNE